MISCVHAGLEQSIVISAQEIAKKRLPLAKMKAQKCSKDHCRRLGQRGCRSTFTQAFCNKTNS
jgi:hypothetical protein